MTAINSLYSSRLQLIQQQQILRSGNINEQNVSLFENTEGLTQGMIDGTCTDGKDDGKIGLWEGIKSIGKGILNFGKNLLQPKNLLKGAACAIGLGLVSLIPVAGPALATAIGGAMIVKTGVQGGIQIGKGIYNATQATTDAEKREALENVGEGAAAVGVSVLAAKGFKNATGKSVLDKSIYKDAATKSAKAAGQFGEFVKTSAKSGFESLKNAYYKNHTTSANTTELAIKDATSTAETVTAPKVNYTDAQINSLFRKAAKELHPDNGGSVAKMQELNLARNNPAKIIEICKENHITFEA